MADQKISNRYGDVVFLSEPPEAVRAASLTDATPTEVADSYLRQNKEELGLAQSLIEGDEIVALTDEAAAASPIITFSHQKDIGDTAVVVYDQFVLGLPIFDARLGVQVSGRAMAVNAAQSSMHSSVEVANPGAASAQLDSPSSISAASLEKILGLGLPNLGDGQIPRQVVYRYEADKRVEVPQDDGPQTCFGAQPKSPIVLPELPAGIKDGSHYVVNEVLFRASRYPDESPVNWRALVEPESGAVLYLRALVAEATGFIFARDPQTQNSGATVTGASTDAQLNPFRSSEPLSGLITATPQALTGEFVQVTETSAPVVPGPQEPNPPALFQYDVRTDNFSAVNAYYHCDNLFRTMADYGFNVPSYFGGTSFPVPVDHCALGNAVNAQAPGNATGTGLGELRFGRLQAGQPVGIATCNRVVWHEFGHGLLWDHVNSPNFGFAHSAGDALAAILNDPGSQAADRFDTFPWVHAGTPGLDRRHNRSIADGWAWFGPMYNTQYNGEQILSTTLFRFYRSIGGDAASTATQVRAAQTSAYLIFKGIGLLTSTTPFPEVFATNLQNADLNTGSFKGIAGGALHKVMRWAFEKQGLYQPAAAPGQGNTVNSEGQPPPVDVYINDGRNGEYQYLANHWSCQDMWVRRAADGGTTHQNPIVGATNFMYVRVKNRGTQTAQGVHVDGYHCLPGSGLSFPDDWVPMATATLPAAGPIAPGGTTIVGPFAFVPTQVGHECLLAIAHANGDPGNDTTITGTIPEHRFVPFDNNVAQRNVQPVFPRPRDLVKIFRKHWLLIRNPFDAPGICRVEIELPDFLRKRRWQMRVTPDDSAKFEIRARDRREISLTIAAGADFTEEEAKRAIAARDSQINVRTYIDDELVGGMTYVLSFDADRTGLSDEPDEE